MKAVIFDIDDTLYPEIEFVKSGFTAVTYHLANKYNQDPDLLLSRMMNILEISGRGKIFDTILRDLGVFSEDNVKLLLYLYRAHQPKISLYEDVLPAIDQLRAEGFCLGIVTDGMGSVQRNKIRALELDNLFDIIVCTDEIGPEDWKPSKTPFNIVLELLDTPAQEAAYVGNDSSKDFIGPNELEMMTIQIVREEGMHLSGRNINQKNADVVVSSLIDLMPVLTGAA
jgi:putative hydrolase of the HAD superfamily